MGRTSKARQLIDESYTEDDEYIDDDYDHDHEVESYERGHLSTDTAQRSKPPQSKNHGQTCASKHDKVAAVTKKVSEVALDPKKSKPLQKKTATIDSICKSFIVGGHVDAGKSTLLGHFLHAVGKVTTKLVQQYEREATKAGKPSFKYAWILDQNQEERSRGTTIDLSIHSFHVELTGSSMRTFVTLIDAPGHQDYINCLIHGAFTADNALLVVDGAELLQKGLAVGTEEHLRIFVDVLGRTSELSIPHSHSSMIIIINKMDKLDWSREAFESCKAILLEYLAKNAPSCTFESTNFIPCSAWSGENLVKQKSDVEWCRHVPTLLQALTQTFTEPRPKNIFIEYSLIMVCQVIKTSSNSAVIDVKVLKGNIKPGMTLYFPFCASKCVLKQLSSIHESDAATHSEKRAVYGYVNQSEFATITCDRLEEPGLSNITRPGQLLWDVAFTPPGWFRSRVLICRLCVHRPISPSAPSTIIVPGTQGMFYYRNTQVPCTISKLISIVGYKDSFPPRFLVADQTAIAHVKLPEEIVIFADTDSHQECDEVVSKFIIHSSGSTMCSGVVIGVS